MKTQSLISCATLAFVNKSAYNNPAIGGKRCDGSHLVRQMPSHLALSNENEEHGSGQSENLFCDHSHRRKFVHAISNSFLMSMLLTNNANSAHAACLSGDIRAECIGVYKLPIDAAETPFVKTPEMLELYAPDLKWVPPVEYPSNYATALSQLKDQRQQLDASQDLVARGELEKAGLVFLDVFPKVNAAGIVILRSFNEASNAERNLAMTKNLESDGNDGNPSSSTEATALEMKAYRIESSFNELVGYLGETDIMIGQGLRGDLGVSAPAQLQILSNIAECRKEFDNLLGTIPESL